MTLCACVVDHAVLTYGIRWVFGSCTQQRHSTQLSSKGSIRTALAGDTVEVTINSAAARRLVCDTVVW